MGETQQTIVHTPGPWKNERLRDHHGNPYSTMYECHVDLGPCMIWCPEGNMEQEANAKLIAAAPELLAACVAFLAAYKTCDGDMRTASLMAASAVDKVV